MSLSLNRCGVGLCVALIALLVASPRAAAEPDRKARAGQVLVRLTEADGQINNFNSRGPHATRELKGLDKSYADRVAPVLKAVKDLLAKAKIAQTATKEAERKYPLLKSGKMSYKAYVKLLNKAGRAHASTLTAASKLRMVAKENRLERGNNVNTKALVNYCATYAEKMAWVVDAFKELE